LFGYNTKPPVITVGIKSYVSSIFELQKFKSSIHFGVGTYIRRSTPTGHDDGKITNANRKHIEIMFKDYTLFKSIKDFDKQDWAILNNKPSWMLDEIKGSK